MLSQNEILKHVITALERSHKNEWQLKIKETAKEHIHVAVMVEPYLSLILSGAKTIESRFSKKRVSPFGLIKSGDIVILKKSGGGYVAVFEAGEIKFFEPQNQTDIQRIKELYNDRLCIADDFWNAKKDARYATLVSIERLCQFEEFKISESNRQSWIDFANEEVRQQSLFEVPMVICIAGKAGSGKTSVARELSAKMNCRYVTISNYLRAKSGKTDVSREELQAIGNECIESGWGTFVHDFLKFINWDERSTLIIDGVRHVLFMDMLRIELYPVRPICVYLDADIETIESHLVLRGGETIDYSPVSEGFYENMTLCSDYILPVNNLSIEQVCNHIILFTDSYRDLTTDKNTNISVLRQYIDCFNFKRGWKKYHNPRDLAMSISIETAELLEIFQWGKGEKSTDRIKEELADVLIYCIDLANNMGLDITGVILEKMKKNARKYPEQ